MMDEMDDGARVGVWVALGVVAFVLFGLLGGLAVKSVHSHKANAAAATKPAAVAKAADEAMVDGPLAGDVAGTLYFGSGQAALPEDGAATVATIKTALDAAAGRKVLLSGFHDASGDPVKNAELAKERAKAVRAALQADGVDAARVGLRKPESTTADGKPEEARRVEIRLVN